MAFLYSLFLTINAVDLIPGIRLMTMAPFLAILLTKYDLTRSLWYGAIAGLFMDMISSNLPFGSHALSYCLSVAALYFYRHYFFFDRRGALALLSGLLSIVNTLIEMFLFSFFDQGLTITASGIAGDFIVMPLCDALYALIFFWLPIEAYGLLRKMWPTIALRIQTKWQTSPSQD